MQAAKTFRMKKTLIILGISTLTAFLSFPGTTLADDIIVPLGSFGGRPVVEVTFPGKGKIPMVMDTGARGVVIADEMGPDFGLEIIGEARIGSPGGGGVPAVVYQPMALRIDGYEFTPSNIIGMDFSGLRKGRPQRLGEPEVKPDEEQIPPGVLGFWELKEGVVAVDFGASTLTISPEGALAPEGKNTLPFAVLEGFPYPQFEMTVAGIQLNGHLDTGAPGVFVMSTDWMEKVPLKEDPVNIGQARLADGTRDIWKGRLDGSVEIAGYTLEDPEIHFLDGVTGVNVGSGFFQGGGFRIDRENDLIEFNRKSE